MIQFIYPYYRNPKMLEYQLNLWASYGDLLKYFRFILIDDCSPEPAMDVINSSSDDVKSRIIPRLKLFRITQDIPWNQHGARNLGVHVASQGRLLLCDIDHIVPLKSALRLSTFVFKSGNYYKFSRVRLRPLDVLQPVKSPNNIFLCRKDQFIKAGGYDEDYCGMYGGDSDFLRSMNKIARPSITSIALILITPEIIPDACTTTLDRLNRDNYLALRREKHRTGNTVPKNPLRFTWEQVI